MDSKNVSQELQRIIAEAAAALGLTTIPPFHLSHPTDRDHGDFSTNIALQTVKQQSKYVTPRELAQALVDHLAQHKEIEKVEVAGPGFINLFLSRDFLVQQTKGILVQGDAFGQSKTEYSGQTWLIEHTSPNPNKAMHLGHLRNNVTGMALANLWEAIGVTVKRDAVDNNRGIAIAKLMWGYLKFAHKTSQDNTDIHYWVEHKDEWLTPEEAGKRPDRFMDELYAKGADDCKNNPDSEARVRQMVVDWENKDPENWELWRTVLNYVYEGQNRTLARLHSRWDKVWHEHEHYQKGKDLVQLGLKNGVFRKLDDGAVLTNLEEQFGITDTIVQKSDGTALYITQDLALTKQKKEAFHPDRMFWVIGPEQSLALKQMFAVCEQLGTGEMSQFTHIPYGYMSIKGQGKMSSRLGNVIYIDDLIDSAKAEVLEKMEGNNFSAEEREDLAEKIAVAAVKYSILKVGRMTNTAFDFETSLSLDGDSGPYLEYTHARCQSVLIQAQDFSEENVQDVSFAWKKEEESLIRWLYLYPEIVVSAGKGYAPNDVCTYLFGLAQRYNALYTQCRILTADTPTQRDFRLMLTQATARVLKNGLRVLGIEAVDRM